MGGRGHARRSVRPRLEDLEARLVMSQAGIIMKPGYKLDMVPVPGTNGRFEPLQSSSPVGYTPIQMQTAYGVNLISFGGVAGNGAGQTIAVIDAGNNPGFKPTGTGFAGSALQVFDQTFGLQNPPSFKMVNQTGGTTLPAPIKGWGTEIALDVEWAHAIAPAASIVLVEANSSSFTDLMQSAYTGAATMGASAVSMSFGGALEYAGVGSIEPQLDAQYLQAALNVHPGTTFLASTGDHGANPGDGPNYPSISPLVVAVGGTKLSINSSNQWAGETGWSYNTDGFCPSCASGGGISNTYTEPSWQQGYQSTGFRTAPDVSSNADPNTGVAVYDPADLPAGTPWLAVGGTSLSSPTWAGFTAIIDQGRAAAGLLPLNGPQQTLPGLYSLPASDFHDITVGYNGYNAGPGYDLVTGRGSPIANLLIPDMVQVGQASLATITIQPPSSVVQGGYFGTVVEALNASGGVAVGFDGTAVMTLASGPAGATFSQVAVPITNGVGIFDGLSLSQLSNGTPYIFNIAVNSPTTTIATATTAPVTVASAATAGVGVYYPLPLDQSLRNDFALAGSNADPTNILNLVYAVPYKESGQIVVANTSSVPQKAIEVVGQGEANSIITTTVNDRLFTVLGTVGVNPNLALAFQQLTLEGGHAVDPGGLILPGNPAIGGALLVEGGAVSFTTAALRSDVAAGVAGVAGARGTYFRGSSSSFGSSFGSGGNGGNGGLAQGGGIYLSNGSVTLNNATVVNDQARGGAGGAGGAGAAGGFTATSGFVPFRLPGGAGGAGGRGGSGAGGAIYVAGGVLAVHGGTLGGDQAVGGAGGAGGAGGRGGSVGEPGGSGGNGANAGQAYGGAIYLAHGQVSFSSASIGSDVAQGGHGGRGGAGGRPGTSGRPGGVGGGGGGAIGQGGGFFLSSGIITFTGTTVQNDAAFGGNGGFVSSSGTGPVGARGPNATGAGGGFYIADAITLSGVLINGNDASLGGGIYAKNGLVLQNDTVNGNSAANGGGIEAAGPLTLTNDSIGSNHVTQGGGGVFALGTVAVAGSQFTSNSASVGGGIDATAGFTVATSSFTSNSARSGGALAVSGTGTVSSSSFTTNSTTYDGGAAIDQIGGSLTVSTATFSGNASAGGGGAIASSDSLIVNQSTFSANTAGTYGGAIVQRAGSSNITKTSFSGGGATEGGAIAVLSGASTVLMYVDFSGNAATSVGGAIDNVGALSLTYGTLSGDSAPSGGGVENIGTATVTASTLYNETATTSGGAIDNSGNFTGVNDTLAMNTGGAGAGVSNEGSGALLLVNVTIADNAGTIGAGLNVGGGGATLYNTIVASNTNSSGASDIAVSGGGSITGASRNNLIGIGGSGGLVNGVNFNLVGVASPGLSALGAYGGPTQTIALLAGSPAIDAGVAQVASVAIPTVDQRGAVRGAAGLNAGLAFDIGAYEASSSILVTSTADTTDVGTLRSAIIWANTSINANPENIANPAPNTAVFDTQGVFVSPQTITLVNGPLVFSNLAAGVAIAGPGPVSVTISGNFASQIVVVDPGVTGAISGVTLEDGSGGSGGAITSQGPLTLSNDVLSGNSAVQGGAVYGTGAISMSGVTASNNTSSFSGGAILAAGSLTVSGSTFTGNRAGLVGGAIAAEQAATVTGSTFTSNIGVVGGAINSTAPLSITNDSFSSNAASASGGAIQAGGSLTITGSTFGLNSANQSGGALDATGSATITASTFTGDTAGIGGGAIASSTTLSVSQSTIEASSAGQGGGIDASGTAMVVDSVLAGDAATAGAGGGVLATGTFTILRSTLSNDSASAGGGVAGSATSTIAVTNSTLANDTASNDGGGVSASGTFTAVNDTLAYNQVATGGQGGGLFAPMGTTTLYNTLIAENTVGAGASTTASDVSAPAGVVAAASMGNLIGVGGSGGLVNGVNSNQVGVANPGISPLAYNGGPTATVALLAGSPAIDGGALSITGVVVPSADQRGALRGPAGLNAGATVDVGAYEASSSYQVETTIDSTAIGTLRTAVLWADFNVNNNPANLANPAPNTVLFDTSGVFSTPQTITLTLGSINLAGTAGNVSIDGTGTSQLTLSGGGASGVITVGSGTTATIQGLTISGGSTAGSGGGVDNSGVLTLMNDVITGNSAAVGAGVSNEVGGVLALDSVVVSSNVATAGGGGVANAGTLTVTGSTITGNQAATGGGLFNSSNASLSGAVLTSNTALSSGGGFENSSSLTIANSSITGNTATATGATGGGGDNAGSLVVLASTLSGNTSAATGGGIANESAGTALLTNATVAGNSAFSGGGLVNMGVLTTVNATIADNAITNGQGGGLDILAGARTHLYNTIVALNTNGQSTRPEPSDIAGALAFDSAYNLIGVGGAGGLVAGVQHNLIGVASPGLGVLANNGGLQQTIGLLAHSPALDAGSAVIPNVVVPTVDERGALRGALGLNAGPNPDIGAYEATSSFLVTSTADAYVPGSLRLAISWADANINTNAEQTANPAPNTITFDSTGVFKSLQTITLSPSLGALALTNPSIPTTIVGLGANVITLNGGGTSGVFDVAAGATASLTELGITGGSAAQGGGIENAGTLTLTSVSVAGNQATTGGGIANSGTLTIVKSTISSDVATGFGGGIVSSGTLTLTNSTVALDSANSGGGLFLSGPATLLNDTIAYNSAATTGVGGGVDVAAGDGSVLLANTIVASNTLGTGSGAVASDIAGLVESTSSFNLIGTGGTGGLVSGSNGNQAGVANPGLGTLTANGGPTLTIALLPGSPALAAGGVSIAGLVVPSTDERGALRAFARPGGAAAVDVGAFEVSSIYLVTTTADNNSAGTLRSAVAWADSNPSSVTSPGPNDIVFDTTGVFSTAQTISLDPNLGTLALSNLTTPIVIEGPGTGLLSINGGGAIGVLSVTAGATATLEGLTVTGGGAAVGAGVYNLGSLTLTDAAVSGNTATYHGGGVYNGGTLTVMQTTFSADKSPFGLGGAIENAGTLTVADSIFSGNASSFQGGAIHNQSGTAAITDSSFTGNSATLGGSLFNNAVMTIQGSTVANTDSFNGGAIANDLPGVLAISNSTVADNFAGQVGGGINNAGALTVVNSTIAYNTVASGGAGGGIDVSNGTVVLDNTIVILNTAGLGAKSDPNDVSGNVSTTSSYNLIGTGGSGGLRNGVAGNQVGVTAPLIGTLASNGGPTQTIALLAASPAIDAGSTTIAGVTVPTIDQRGALRGPLGQGAGTTVDIGAFEASSSYLVTSSADTGDVGTLSAAVSWANQNINNNPANLTAPAANTIVFDATGLFATPQTITLGGGPLVLSNATTPIAIEGLTTAPVTISGGGLTGVFQVASGTTASLSYLTITGGSALGAGGTSGLGGGIDNQGTLTVSSSTVSSSTAIDGGGVANEAGGVLMLVASTLSNDTGTSGGGLYNAGSASLVNDTIALDSALNGGGVYNTGTLSAVNVTIADNTATATGTGGGLDVASGSVSIDNTIVAQNTLAVSNGTTPSDVAGVLAASSAYNLIGTGGSGGLVNGVLGNQVGVASPGLAPLAANGGPTRTIALITTPASPAIGTGSSAIPGILVPTVDQRGDTRGTTIDVGAYQSTPVIPPPISPITLVRAPVFTMPIVVTAPVVQAAAPAQPSPAVVVMTSKIHPRAGAAARFQKSAHKVAHKAAVHHATHAIGGPTHRLVRPVHALVRPARALEHPAPVLDGRLVLHKRGR